MENLAKAVIAVMKAVKGIDKTMTVGTGNSSYKGVSDQTVKQVIGKAMEDNGLCILPLTVKPTSKIERWEETSSQYGTKQKQSIFTEVETTYMLLHESGENVTIAGYGHGIDSQDKGAGKATTYALKYALLYTFMIATGKIDDSDNTHSDTHETPPAKIKPALTPQSGKWQGAINALLNNNTTIEKIEAGYTLTPEHREQLLSAAI